MKTLKKYLTDKNYRAVGLSADWVDETYQLTNNTVLTISDDDTMASFVSYIDTDEGRLFKASNEYTGGQALIIIKELRRTNWRCDIKQLDDSEEVATNDASALLAIEEYQKDGVTFEQIIANYDFTQ